jgi:hypothetical protein
VAGSLLITLYVITTCLSSVKLLSEATCSLNYPPQVTLKKIIQVRKHATGVTEITSLVEQENWVTGNSRVIKKDVNVPNSSSLAFILCSETRYKGLHSAARN